MIEFFVDRIVAVDRESGQLDLPTSDLLDEVVQEFGDRRGTVETDNLKKTNQRICFYLEMSLFDLDLIRVRVKTSKTKIILGLVLC